jgi:type I restriction enzyme S subunit
VSWPLAALGDIAPAKPIKLNGYTSSDRIWHVTLDQIESNTGLLLEKSIKPLSEAGSSTHAFDDRHVLYSKLRPYLNKVLLPNEVGLGTTELVPMLPASGKLDRVYLAHYLKSKTFVNWISSQTAGAKMPRVSMNTFWEHEIPLPPLAEQKRIAAILDKADSLRRKNQQAIQLADKFLRAVFLDLFGDSVTNPKGWGAVKLGHYCEVGSSKRVFVNEFTGSGIPFYRGTEVGRLSENIDIKPHLFISNNHYDNLKKHSGVPEIGDLLLPSICHDGRIWKVDHKDPFYFKDGRVLWIKVNQNSINSDYLRSYLKNLFLANYSSIASGTTFVELKIVNLKEISVLAPPLDLQIKFSEITNKVIKNYRVNKVSLGKSDELFHSLSQKAFAGEL